MITAAPVQFMKRPLSVARSNAIHYRPADSRATALARAIVDGFDEWRGAWTIERLQASIQRGLTSELLDAAPLRDALRFPVGEALNELLVVAARTELKRLAERYGWSARTEPTALGVMKATGAFLWERVTTLTPDLRKLADAWEISKDPGRRAMAAALRDTAKGRPAVLARTRTGDVAAVLSWRQTPTVLDVRWFGTTGEFPGIGRAALQQAAKEAATAGTGVIVTAPRGAGSFYEAAGFVAQGGAQYALPAAGARAFAYAAPATLTSLSAIVAPSLTLRFPAAEQFARGYSYDLITRVSDKTRGAVQDTLLRALQEGGHPYEQARMIRDSLGLLPQHANAVENYRKSLVEQGRSPAQIASMTERYRTKLINYRAKMVARTETIRAQNAGQYALWQQAVQQGFLERPVLRWVTATDERVCEWCGALDGTTVELGDDFAISNGKNGYSEPHPPLHPQCRCALVLEGDAGEKQKPELLDDVLSGTLALSDEAA